MTSGNVFELYRAEQQRLHSLSGRGIVVFLAFLAVVQFAILDYSNTGPPSRERLLLIAASLSFFWTFAPVIGYLLASQQNGEKSPGKRLLFAWKNYGPLPVFAMSLLSFTLMAGIGAGNVYEWSLVSAMIYAGFFLDVAGFSVMQIWRPGKIFLALLGPRFLVGSVLAVQGTLVLPDDITFSDRIFAQFPALVAALFAQWTVWVFTQYTRQLQRTAALRRITLAELNGELSDSEREAQLRAWQRLAIAGDETPDAQSSKKTSTSTPSADGPSDSA